MDDTLIEFAIESEARFDAHVWSIARHRCTENRNPEILRLFDEASRPESYREIYRRFLEDLPDPQLLSGAEAIDELVASESWKTGSLPSARETLMDMHEYGKLLFRVVLHYLSTHRGDPRRLTWSDYERALARAVRKLGGVRRVQEMFEFVNDRMHRIVKAMVEDDEAQRHLNDLYAVARMATRVHGELLEEILRRYPDSP